MKQLKTCQHLQVLLLYKSMYHSHTVFSMQIYDFSHVLYSLQQTVKLCNLAVLVQFLRKNYMFWANGQLDGFGNLRRSYLDGSDVTTIADTNIISPGEKNIPEREYHISLNNNRVNY